MESSTKGEREECAADEDGEGKDAVNGEDADGEFEVVASSGQNPYMRETKWD